VTPSERVARPRLRPNNRTPRPHSHLERSLFGEGFGVVAGLDEVGRGAWAGPVSVGVVVFPREGRAPRGLCDSKLLSEEQREELFPRVVRWCDGWAVGHVSALDCDRLGMTAALRLAARRALRGLAWPADVVIMDGSFDYVSEPNPDDRPVSTSSGMPHVRTVVKGDAACASVAAASIVAKVTRDRLMRSLSASFPAYDFDLNKGYPSPVHKTALAGFGLTSLHRRTWAFVDGMVFR
jgi:ribonuclease HII